MPVLVLNSSLQPLSVIPERRLIVLLSKQKVTFVDDSVRQVIEESIQARRLELERPVIVQLLANVRIPRMALQPTRANILLRDDETCQYTPESSCCATPNCGRHTKNSCSVPRVVLSVRSGAHNLKYSAKGAYSPFTGSGCLQTPAALQLLRYSFVTLVRKDSCNILVVSALVCCMLHQ